MTSEVMLINDEGEISEVGLWTISPKEALICAINHVIYKNFDFWKFYQEWNPVKMCYENTKKYDSIKETKHGFSYFFGENSVLYVRKSLEEAC